MTISTKDIVQYQFIVKTYNHELYINDYLYSLKYQILNYSKNYRIHLYVIDDFSDDLTLNKVKSFVQKNSNLFHNFKIVQSDRNLGINHNQQLAIKNIITINFHIMDGDDFYSNYNVFEFIDISKNYDYVFSPNIHFRKGNHLQVKYAIISYFRVMFSSKKLKILLRYNHIPNPGSKVSLNAINYNLELASRMSNSSEFFEGKIPLAGGDYLAWLILFKDNKFLYYFYSKPIVIYRITSGISNNRNHPSFYEARKYSLIEFYGMKLGPLNNYRNSTLKLLIKSYYRIENALFFLIKHKERKTFLKDLVPISDIKDYIDDYVSNSY